MLQKQIINLSVFVLGLAILPEGISDQVPDGIYRADLLAQNLEPDENGRRRVAFNFVASN